MSGARRLATAFCAALLLCFAAGPAAAAHINVAVVDGSINPASSDYIQQSIATSEKDGAAALILELDTPGGLLSSTKDIIQAILNSRVPVVVYVAPRGAWAASAGTFITLAGHIAAMAPGTSIGAASPISAGGGGGDQRDEKGERIDVAQQKAEKFTAAFIESIAKERDRNVEWAVKAVEEAEAISQDKALELHVIDLVAPSRAALIEAIDGREVKVDGKPEVLHLKDASVQVLAMTPLQRLFNFLASPDIAVILVMVGLLGLYVEFNHPGLLLPGIVGGICLVLAAIAFQILPFSWVGLLLILAGLGLLAAEVFVTSYGLLFVAGLACFLLGGSMLFNMPDVSDLSVSFWSVLVPTVVGFGLFAMLVIYAVGSSALRRQTAGVSDMIGKIGRSDTALTPEGRVFVRGEYWNARGDEEIAANERVVVTAVEGMRLRVRRATSEV